MREQEIQRRIQRELKARGVWVFKVITANRNGVPDLVGCHQGLFLGIEVKRPGHRPSEIQLAQLERIRDAGGVAIVADSWESALEQLQVKNVI